MTGAGGGVLYWEDFHPGREFDLGEVVVDEGEMLAFAHRFDPQPFHVDEQQAAVSPFGGVIASGWFTASLCMRLLVDGVLRHSVSLGSPGVDALRWRRPVRAGDRLHARLAVVTSRPSQSRREMGIITSLLSGDVDGQPAITLEATSLLGRRPA